MSRLLIVGAGGIGAPAAIALCEAWRRRGAWPKVRVCDDDAVELSNLHRQVMFDERDVGRSKVLAFTARMRERCPGLDIEAIEGRFMPETAADLATDVELVLDACDNFASRFLMADAAYSAHVPIVHAAAVRWHATVFAASSVGGPCYRCLFEDLPSGDAPDCATAGVFGPVCGVAGGLAADLVLRILDGDSSAFGRIHTFDGTRDLLRSVGVPARADCELCGSSPVIRGIEPSRYEAKECRGT